MLLLVCLPPWRFCSEKRFHTELIKCKSFPDDEQQPFSSTSCLRLSVACFVHLSVFVRLSGCLLQTHTYLSVVRICGCLFCCACWYVYVYFVNASHTQLFVSHPHCDHIGTVCVCVCVCVVHSRISKCLFLYFHFLFVLFLCLGTYVCLSVYEVNVLFDFSSNVKLMCAVCVCCTIRVSYCFTITANVGFPTHT